MHSPPKKVLIVDDSRVMRAWLRNVLSSDARLEVVGEAEDALKARDFLRANPADVVTLDIEMPGMSGLEFLTRLMRAHPMPVVMMSSLTAAGSEAAVHALSRGAVDCMVKPSKAYGPELTLSICETVFNAACTRPSQLKRTAKINVPTTPKQATIARPCEMGPIILIGASTGGVGALEAVLPDLDPNGPPVVVVQHMPGNFLVSFTERLSRNLPQNVVLAQEGLELRRGDIVIAPGISKHTQIRRRNNVWKCEFAENDPPSLHCPSVDSLFMSAVSEAKHVSAAILTGLGRDGAEGLLRLEQSGATTFGQNEETCVVYGMPRAANALGAVQSEVALEKIGLALKNAGSRRRRPRNIIGGLGAE